MKEIRQITYEKIVKKHPMALRDYKIMEALNQGKTMCEVAREWKISARTVYRIRDVYQ